MCGGVIIADNRILTGAHCNNDGVSIAQSILVVVGSNLLFSGGTRVQMQSVVMHPGYNPRIIANDLAVLRIPRISYTCKYLNKCNVNINIFLPFTCFIVFAVLSAAVP